MESKGQLLKQKLGLSKMPYVKIRRCITASSVPIYHIVFNSRLPNVPLTSYRLDDSLFAPYVLASDKVYYTPWILIDNFHGEPSTKLFFVSDLAGFYGKATNYSESVQDKKYLVFHGKYNLLQEFITLPALTDKNANLTSELTQKYKDIRLNTGQIKDKNGKVIKNQATANTKLITTEMDNNNVIFKFLTEATEMYPPNHKFQQVNPATKELQPNPSKTYEIWIKLLDVVGDNGWLSTFDQEKETLSQKDIKDILTVSNCQIWVNDPSFQFQGFNYWLTVLDASIVPEDRKPTGGKHGWLHKHGDGEAFLTKHLSQLFDQLSFFFNQMAASLTGLLRKEGYLKKYRRK